MIWDFILWKTWIMQTLDHSFSAERCVSQGTGNLKHTGKCHGEEVYLRQFDGRCIKRLAFSYGNRLKDFRTIMEHISAFP